MGSEDFCWCVMNPRCPPTGPVDQIARLLCGGGCIFILVSLQPTALCTERAAESVPKQVETRLGHESGGAQDLQDHAFQPLNREAAWAGCRGTFGERDRKTREETDSGKGEVIEEIMGEDYIWGIKVNIPAACLSEAVLMSIVCFD